ncbi:MAG: tetratricopeptide repeat protein [Thermomonas sp.]
MTDPTTSRVFDATATTFEETVIRASLETPVLINFWAAGFEPCEVLSPLLEKLAVEYNGAFLLAKVDVAQEQELASAFQIQSVPTVILVKNGQLLDGFPGALPEDQVKEFLTHHGIAPAPLMEDETLEVAAPPVDPHEEVMRLRKAMETEPDKAELKLDLALALLQTGATTEAQQLLDGLPANLATDDRTIKAHARLGFSALLKDAPPVAVLEAAIIADPADLRARHMLGVRQFMSGDAEAGLVQFIEMLQRDRNYENGLARKTLIDAFRVLGDDDLVSRYRRKMSSLLLV